ncbi:MAG: sigma 54-interacting transcriptional regulator [Bacteroidota bacterium]|jgi:Nif-specific regulatory protein|nr:sigma 54-interacting transcriptional regulator [Bacteroidota bacterium]
MVDPSQVFPSIPHCTVDAVAGRGGMGTVYRARRDDGDGRPVAVKVLHAGDPARRTRMQEEFRLLGRIEHPALARLFDFGYLEDGRPFFIMEWIDGAPVSPADVRDGDRLDNTRFATLIYDITAALAFIHSQHVVHGDLKPANVSIADGRPRLMDFGLGTLLGDAADGVADGTGATVVGLSGTLEYLAPERIRGAPPSPASDLYALGCLLFELATGAPPFEGGDALTVLRAQMHEDVPPLPDELAPDIAGWIRTLLEKQPQRRWRTAMQLHTAAARFLEREPALGSDGDTAALRLLDLPRTQELARVREARTQSTALLHMLVVEGPEGIGKTRFLREAAAAMQIDGASVSRLEFRAGDDRFGPILRLLDTRVERNDVSSPLLSAVATWFPDAFTDIEPAPRDGLSDDSLRLRAQHAAVALLCRHAAPEVLVIDNLHLADAFTREFFRYLLSWAEANAHGAMFLLAALDTAADDGPPLDDTPLLERLRLPALTKAEVAQTLRDLLGAVSASFAEVIARQSKGIPGRIEDLLNFCLAEGILETTEHGWLVHERENLGGIFPTSLSDFYARAVARLQRDPRLLLTALAETPAPCAVDALAAVTGLAPSALHAAIAVLRRQELIEGGADALRPAHDAVRAAAVIPPGEDPSPVVADGMMAHAPLHDRWYAWHAAHPPRLDADAVLAHHAARGSDPGRTLAHALAAAEYRERRFDYTGAEAMLRLALPLLSDGDTVRRFAALDALCRLYNILGRRGAEEDALEEMLLLAAQSNSTARLATVYRNQTQHYLAVAEFDRARRSAEKALACYDEEGDALGQGWCRQKIGFTEYRTRPGAHVLTHYQAARELYGKAAAMSEEAAILIDIGLVHYSVLENPARALECFDEARRMFEAVGDRRGRTRAIGNMGAQLYALGRYEDALAQHHQANMLAAEAGDRRLLATSFGAMGQCEIALCRYSPALLHLREELRIAREINDAYLQEMCLENLGELHMTLGDYDHAIEAYTQAQELATTSGNTAGLAAGHIDIAGCLIEKRDFDGASKLLRKAVTLLEDIQDVNITAMLQYRSGILHLRRGADGDHDQALAFFNRLGDIADQHGFDSFRILARSYAGLTQLQLGRASAALELSTDALALAEAAGALYGGMQDILFHHAQILRANREPAAAADFVTRAHATLMRHAEAIEDPTLSHRYLDAVPVHAEIVREYARTHRGESPQALTAVREQNLRTLYAVARKINSVLDLDILLDAIMDSALEAMNGERGLIFLIENEQLTLKVSRNVEKETIRDATEISLSILRDVLHAGTPIIVSDTAADEEFRRRDSVVNFNIHSLICVPMRARDEIIGTVYVDSRSDALAAMSFSDIDAEFLEAFANLASMAIENARLHEALKKENLYLRREVEQRFGFEHIIGDSAPMKRLYDETQAAIQSAGSVLISGESGTGKELIAKAIHYNGPRRAQRFVAVDCGALPDTLLESELFGYKRGAFTGAVADKPGLFEEAHNGTLFLDEISNTSLAFQAKLLRVLQEGEFRRVGETKTRQVDVRVICATNTILQEEIEAGRFRQDLFYRLNVIPITVPPLRNRIGDIPLLISYFITRYNAAHPSPVRGASSDLVDFLQKLPWNGNVRELENLVNRMIAQSPGEMLTVRMLPSDYASLQKTAPDATRGEFEVSLKSPRRLRSLQDMEMEHIAFVLRHTDGNKTEAAKILGLKRTTLVEKMKKLGMM